jgi:tetratricopeptide (TPR) repeat protein
MERKPSPGKALALEPLEVSTPGDDAARPQGDKLSAQAKAKRDLRMTTSDEFLAKAAKEYQEGQVDKALWRRAADKCGNDASLMVPTYLRCRATSLQLQHKKDQSAQILARGASGKRGATDRDVESEPGEKFVSTKFVGDRPRTTKSKVGYMVAAVAAALVATVVVVYVMVLPPENDSARPQFASTAARMPRLGEQAIGKSAGGTNPASPEPSLEVTVQQLKSAGKWQVLVLYATEWTRREPDNAAAWSDLSIGYAKLQQFGEALDAAKKAVHLSPGDALFWRNLGHLNLEVDRMPDAGIAFAKALAVNPDDADARCGAALVAQRQARPKDPDTAIKRVKTNDGSCPDVSDGESAAATPAASAARKPASPVSR